MDAAEYDTNILVVVRAWPRVPPWGLRELICVTEQHRFDFLSRVRTVFRPVLEFWPGGH